MSGCATATIVLADKHTHPQVSGSREVFTILVKGDCHDPVSSVEGLLHAVTMVDVNVDVQHPLVVPGWKSVTRQQRPQKGGDPQIKRGAAYLSSSRMARTMSLT